MKKVKLPSAYFNYISLLGTIIASIATITLLFLVVMTKLQKEYNVYNELIIYIIVPMFLVLGLVMIAAGIIIRRRKVRKGINGIDDKIFVINLKEEKTRNSLIIITTVTIFFVICTVVGSYEAFHYTESIEFCGKLCHNVMNPEYASYQNSPHARVKCAECHIGEGVNWYVKSKLSGLRQVYKYLTVTYPRPIATPIENLRPARETCEKCHWPQKFYTHKLHQEKYYLSDSANTEWNIVLNMKIGASHQSLGLTQGIHWHINPDIKMEYKTNARHDTIPWVKLINIKTRKETVYQDEENTLTADALKKLSPRTMDCMDCHNRPSHEFRSPAYYVNNLFASAKIPTSIPWLKQSAMEALGTKYSTSDSARIGINKKIIDFYKSEHADIYKKSAKEIKNAIAEIINAYSQNAFPDMKISYVEYPRHIGHLEANGCFRCHDNKHKAPNGKVITKDCNLCHTNLGQGAQNNISFSAVNKTVEFIHPVDIGDLWKDSNCTDCH